MINNACMDDNFETKAPDKETDVCEIDLTIVLRGRFENRHKANFNASMLLSECEKTAEQHGMKIALSNSIMGNLDLDNPGEPERIYMDTDTLRARQGIPGERGNA